jgi:TfoX/Sxy family transcriptional regulator of competence genes
VTGTTLAERIREVLAGEPSLQEKSMFGGRAFMVNGKMVAHARTGDDLLVRVDAERHDELLELPGAAQSEMGQGRSMGPGWVTVSAESITSEEQLSFWLGEAMEHNRATDSEA